MSAPHVVTRGRHTYATREAWLAEHVAAAVDLAPWAMLAGPPVVERCAMARGGACAAVPEPAQQGEAFLND